MSCRTYRANHRLWYCSYGPLPFVIRWLARGRMADSSGSWKNWIRLSSSVNSHEALTESPSADLELVSCGEFLPADEGGRKLEESGEVLAVAFVAECQPSVAGEPRERAFDLPAVPTQPLGALDAAAGDARHDAPQAQPATVCGRVVGLVRPELGGCAAAGTAPGAHRGDRADHRLQHRAVVGVRRGHAGDQRNSLGVGHHVNLRAGLAAVDRARPGQRAPFFARTYAESRIAEDQSRSPAAPSRSRTSRCSFSNTPARAQEVNRRCAVGTVTPNEGGRSRQAHPLVSTYTTAVNTARSSTGADPPPCGRGVNFGISGAAISHNSSGTNRSDNVSITSHSMPHTAIRPHETSSY